MEINTTINISILISACLAIIGWMVNNYLKRRHEIAKKRLALRIETLSSVTEINQEIQKNNSISKVATEKINTTITYVKLYGNREENILLDEFVTSINSANSDKILKSLKVFTDLAIANIRKELKLDQLK